ncbi:MAG: hypothetical protein QNJ03_13465 [Dinoroseobacter sp.]|nr:hypothetical protein [Dinoroseobacter sp.]
MKAVHFLCERDGIGLHNLKLVDKERFVYESGYWAISASDAEHVINGMIFLHGAKSKPSEFGGQIIGFREEILPEFARQKRVVFIFRATKSGRGVRWSGKSHAMSHYSGIVDWKG